MRDVSKDPGTTAETLVTVGNCSLTHDSHWKPTQEWTEESQKEKRHLRAGQSSCILEVHPLVR